MHLGLYRAVGRQVWGGPGNPRRLLTVGRVMATGVRRGNSDDTGGKWRLFEDGSHAELYQKYRPNYPPSVVAAIVEFCEAGGCGRDLAVDVACGSGQSTWPLAAHFKRVIGTDISEAQIGEANRSRHLASNGTAVSNVEFTASKAEDLGFLRDGSVDLMTCAQGLHWFDRGAFYTEARRVLKQGGVIAPYGYGNQVLEAARANEMLQEFYDVTLHGHWSPQRRHVERHYADFDLPFADFTRVGGQAIERVMPLRAFTGYLSSWSAYRSLLDKHPQSTALEDLHKDLLEVFREGDSSNEDPVINVKWPIFILLARNA